MISIRKATEGDLPWILELEQEAFSPPWTHGTLLSEVYKEDSYFAIAVENEKKLGFIIMRSMVDCGELLQIAVGTSVRRRGVADFLMSVMLDNARESTIPSIFLEVRKSNAAAINLYKKHGYTLIRRRKNYYTNPIEDALVMSVRLDG